MSTTPKSRHKAMMDSLFTLSVIGTVHPRKLSHNYWHWIPDSYKDQLKELKPEDLQVADWVVALWIRK